MQRVATISTREPPPVAAAPLATPLEMLIGEVRAVFDQVETGAFPILLSLLLPCLPRPWLFVSGREVLSACLLPLLLSPWSIPARCSVCSAAGADAGRLVLAVPQQQGVQAAAGRGHSRNQRGTRVRSRRPRSAVIDAFATTGVLFHRCEANALEEHALLLLSCVFASDSLPVSR